MIDAAQQTITMVIEFQFVELLHRRSRGEERQILSKSRKNRTIRQ